MTTLLKIATASLVNNHMPLLCFTFLYRSRSLFIFTPLKGKFCDIRDVLFIVYPKSPLTMPGRLKTLSIYFNDFFLGGAGSKVLRSQRSLLGRDPCS